MSRVVIAIVMSMALAACGDGVGGGGGVSGGGEVVLHTVGGSISGLTASGLVLANGGDTRSVDAGATSFTLPTSVAAGSSFNVIVQTQPIDQTCSVAGGSGTVGSTNVTSVAITCSPNTFSLGGSISGLTASGLMLANGSDTLTVDADASAFTFPTALTTGSSFAITVNTQPAGLTCSVASGSGVVGNANVNNAVVTCSTRAFTLGGSIEGLTTSGLVLANGGDTLAVDAGVSSFTFPALVAQGGGFDVLVQSQPTGQTCSVAGGSGTMGEANVTGVTITCGVSTFTVGGSISGLISDGLVLENGGDTLSVDVNDTSFTLPTPVAFGSSFNVTVQSQPSGLTCSVFNGIGTMGAANVTNVAVTCSAEAFTLGGTISGLISDGLVLENGGDTLRVDVNTSSFTLPTPVAFGSNFDVTVPTHPTGLTCTVSNGKGTMGAANVTSVVVTCSANAFTLGGSIIGLASGGLVLANGSDTLAMSANANRFSMPMAVADGSAFEVTVQNHADEHTCSVSNGSGTMSNADVTSVLVTCVPATFTVSTFAGTPGVRGSADGSRTAASFNYPNSVAVDGSGNVYVADRDNHKIRKITAAGVVSTFAGSGTAGSDNGIGAAASFDYPTGIAVDGSGTVYVADTGNNKIRKITPAGEVSTFAGWGEAGDTDASGTAATFNYPYGIAVDGSGTVYVVDRNNHKIRKITAAGVVSTLAGSGTPGMANGSGTAAQFRNPTGVAVAVDGSTVYVADQGNLRVRKISAVGDVVTLAGSGAAGSDDGSGTAASFRNPLGIAVDGSGTVYVADAGSVKIRRITSTGVVSTFAGSGASGSVDSISTVASFSTPSGVAVDGSGTVYVADLGNHKIRKITAGLVSTFAGSGARGSADGTGVVATFFSPFGIAVDSGGAFYVTDVGSDKIRKITPAGVVSTLAGSGAAGGDDGIDTAASFNDPSGVVVDGSGAVYVVDTSGSKIRKISRGWVSTVAGSGAAGSTDGSGTEASFHNPVGIAFDDTGTFYVADRDGHKIRKITTAGEVSTFAGSGAAGSDDGTGTAAQFNLPTGIAIDSSGTLYVTDRGNNKIRKITPAGEVSTFAGSGAQGSADGIGTAASFNFPSGIAVDRGGTVYLAEYLSHKIRKITPAGVVSTLAGSGAVGSDDGVGTAASFRFPEGVVVDGSGTLYVTDRGNSIIRKIARD